MTEGGAHLLLAAPHVRDSRQTVAGQGHKEGEQSQKPYRGHGCSIHPGTRLTNCPASDVGVPWLRRLVHHPQHVRTACLEEAPEQ